MPDESAARWHFKCLLKEVADRNGESFGRDAGTTRGIMDGEAGVFPFPAANCVLIMLKTAHWRYDGEERLSHSGGLRLALPSHVLSSSRSRAADM